MTTLEKILRIPANKILISLSASTSWKGSIEIYVGFLVHKNIKFIFFTFFRYIAYRLPLALPEPVFCWKPVCCIWDSFFSSCPSARPVAATTLAMTASGFLLSRTPPTLLTSLTTPTTWTLSTRQRSFLQVSLHMGAAAVGQC